MKLPQGVYVDGQVTHELLDVISLRKESWVNSMLLDVVVNDVNTLNIRSFALYRLIKNTSKTRLSALFEQISKNLNVNNKLLSNDEEQLLQMIKLIKIPLVSNDF